MAVTVKIPTQLRAATGGEAEVEVAGSPSARSSTPSSRPTATCASGSPRTATCAASSTSTSAARTSASSRASRPQINEGDEVTILPAVAGG